jgi:eight-cysteine-cluster-containing protein
MLFSILLTGAAFAPAGCTFTVEETEPPEEACPVYDVAPCAEGAYATTELDAYGCEVPVCTSCPSIDLPACAPGQRLVIEYDQAGCEVGYCAGEGVGCPDIDFGECPPDSVLEFTTDANGCSVPHCVPVEPCGAVEEPVCGYGEHIEYVMNDCACPEPVCVPDYGCTTTIDQGAADPAIDGGAGAAYPCCPPYVPQPCPDGMKGVESYDAYGCPTLVCEPVGDCVVGGCSGQLCGEQGDELVTTCEWHDSYACYQRYGVCERQADGQCGWTASELMDACLTGAGAH